jgi:phosphate-selective porin
MIILQAKTGDDGLSGSLAEQEYVAMKTLSLWIATLVLGVVASATHAAVTPDAAIKTTPVVGAQSVSKPVASKKTGGEQTAWCYRRWNGTWGCI